MDNTMTINASDVMSTGEADDHSAEHLTIISIRYTVGLMGILANLFVLVVFLWAKIHRKSFTHLLLLHQSAIDLIASCLFLVYYTNETPDGIRGTVFCKTRSIFWSFAFASTYNLVIVTIERYIAVVHPTIYREKIHGKSNKRYLIIPHIAGIIVACHLAVLGDTNGEGKCFFDYKNDASQLTSGLFIFIISWLIPSLIMFICYGYILKTLHSRVNRFGKECASVSGRGGNSLQVAQRSLTYTLLFVAIAFMLCWTPNYFLYLSYTICKCFEFNSSIAHEITVILDALNLMINPIIYAFKFNDFKVAVKKLYKEHFGKCNFNEDTHGQKEAESTTGTGTDGVSSSTAQTSFSAI